MGLTLFVTNVVSLCHKELGAYQGLSSKFLESFNPSLFRNNRCFLQQRFKCNILIGTKNS